MMTKIPRGAPQSPFPESELYTRLGVSAAKEDVERAATMLPVGLVPSAFCRIAPDVFQQDLDYCSISHSDGAGSKSILAYLKLREDGAFSGFKAIAHDALVMNLDDVLCCGVTTGFSYVSVINRNAHRVGGDVLSAVIEGTLETIEELSRHGVKVVFCGRETADVGDVVQTILVDGALTTRFRRDLIVRNQLKPGHVVVALSGHGPAAAYERHWNSGIASNGITLARRALLSPDIATRYPEVAGNETGEDAIYFGPWRCGDVLPGSESTVLDALLAPTRTFAPIIHAFLEVHRPQVSGIFHNTGGGQVKSLKAARDVHICKRIPTPFPPVFSAIERQTGLSSIEMAKVFSLGWRMDVYCEDRAAAALIDLAAAHRVEAVVVGHVAKGTAGRRRLTLTIDDVDTTFEA